MDKTGLWCDDISFCPSRRCTRRSCPRNKKNIRDRTVPHSFFKEIPPDCPKRNEEKCEVIHNVGSGQNFCG